MKVKLLDPKCKPFKKYHTSSGFDLKARLDHPIVIRPKSSSPMIPSGIKIQLSEGYEAQVRPRSGLGCKHDVVSLLGTIDSEYRGEINIKLFNFSDKPFTINPYDRVCQLVVQKVELPSLEYVDQLDETERGESGFGSTGKI